MNNKFWKIKKMWVIVTICILFCIAGYTPYTGIQTVPQSWTGLIITASGAIYESLNGVDEAANLTSFYSPVPQGVIGMTNFTFTTYNCPALAVGAGTNVLYWLVTNGVSDFSHIWTNTMPASSFAAVTNDTVTYKSLAGITNLYWGISNTASTSISLRPGGAYAWVKQ